jgi:hypothetical protein
MTTPRPARSRNNPPKDRIATRAGSLSSGADFDPWPPLPLDNWLPTYETLQRWTQIVGKTRLELAPFVNHWWHCALYVTPCGLTTSAMPYGRGIIEVEFDFLEDALSARTSDGNTSSIRLQNESVADFYRRYRELLASLGIEVHINGSPNELRDATPFAEDVVHATYDADAARRCWRALVQVDRLLNRFRGQFSGKCSPSHLWWGSFDMACTRFSGRVAPPHPGGIPNLPLYVVREAYSRECISAGWWPGSPGSSVAEPAFYAYAYPEPKGCDIAPIEPDGASYNSDMREWVLPYEVVRTSSDPDAMVMRFLEATYETAARLGRWDVESLRASPPDE